MATDRENFEADREADRENFEAWFGRPLERLYPNKKEFGFIILMSALPLLERYVRRKENIQSFNLGGTPFYDRFARIFPEIDLQSATPFWKACRHGLLHHSTFNTRWGGNPVYVTIIPGVPKPIEKKVDGHSLFFVLEPVHFCSRVLRTIRDDFGVYTRAGELPRTMTVYSEITATLSPEGKAAFSRLDPESTERLFRPRNDPSSDGGTA